MSLIDADKVTKPIYAEEDNITGYGMTYDEMRSYNAGIDVAWGRIELAPTVDAVEVVHGHWIPIKCETGVEAFGVKEMTVEGFKCSVCGEEIDVSEGHFNYCPNCGAKMDGEETDD